MITRRKFSTVALATTAIAGMPLKAFGARPTADLVVTSVQWSDDGGVNWGNDLVDENAPITFRAVVSNTGKSAVSPLQPFRVEFRIDAQTVAFVDHSAGLSAGASVTLVSNQGSEGGIWTADIVGDNTLLTVVDTLNAVPERNENNNSFTAILTVLMAGGGGTGLVASGPVTVTQNGQIVENLDITATGTASGVRVSGFSDVIVRNCRIRYATGRGMTVADALRLNIHDIDIICTGAPSAGPNPSSEMNGIDGFNCPAIRIDRVRCKNTSTGAYLQACDNAWVSNIEGYDMRGPLPRGQIVQFNDCTAPLLEDFSVINQGHIAWTEDNVNCFACTDPHIRRGFIRGNNSSSGQGVIIENFQGGSGGLIEDVDCVYWANGAFMANGASSHVQFWRCRARDGMYTLPNNSVGKLDYEGNPIPDYNTWLGAQANNNTRTPISSGGEAFFAYQTSVPDIEFHLCEYFNIPKALAYDRAQMTVEEFALVDFVPRAPIKLVFPWETGEPPPPPPPPPPGGLAADALGTKPQTTAADPWSAFTINIATDANLVVVMIAREEVAGNDVLGVTVGGFPCTLVPNSKGENGSGSNENSLEAWWLPNPPTGVQPVVIDLGAADGGYAIARSYKAANTATPPRAFRTQAAVANNLTAEVTGVSDGSMFLTGMCLNSNNNNAAPVGTGHVSLFSGAAGGEPSMNGAFGEKGPVAGTANQTLGWSSTDPADRMLVLAMEILKA